MDEERAFVQLFARYQGLTLEPPKPEDSFQLTAAQLDQAHAEAQALVRQTPELDLSANQHKELGGSRYPDLGGVAGLFESGLRKNPGMLEGPLGNPELWERVMAHDRANGRMVWAGQLLQRGGETGELTAVAAEVGLSGAALRKADQIIKDPATSTDLRAGVNAAFCEVFRLHSEQAAQAEDTKKALAQKTQPLLGEVEQNAERGAMTRAVEGFLKMLKGKEAP